VLKTIKRFEKGSVTCRHSRTHRYSSSFKSGKKPTENRKRWWGRETENNKGEGTNVKMFSDHFPVLTQHSGLPGIQLGAA